MKKQEGFKGQRTVILPAFIIDELRKDPLGNHLYLTDIGYYPNALHHYRIREEGCDQHILIYCTDGEGWFSIHGKRNKVKANQFFIIPRGVPHAYGCQNDKPWSIYWLHFSGTLASRFYDARPGTQTIAPSKVARIDDRIQLFEEIIQNLEMGYSQENLAYANICLWHFLASFKYISQFRQIRKIREKDIVEDAIFFMKEHLNQKLTLEEMAREAELSASHFSMIFRKKTARSPMDYLIHLRIQKACQLLDASGLRINEVAPMVGYEDPYYFSRIFKNIMGVSPVAYKNQLKG